MKRRICALFLLLTGFLPAQDLLREDLESCYRNWRQSILTRNSDGWAKATAVHRQMEVKNRIRSEKKAFPAAVFDLPGQPPAIEGLKFLALKRSGPTAAIYYFGTIDFGAGATAPRSLLSLHFVGAGRSWLYDRAMFENLVALPDVQGELEQGKLGYLDERPDLLPKGQIPPVPAEVREAPFIAKVYVYCPGREVRVQVNGISQHHAINDKVAELVIGGARPGENTVQLLVQDMPEATEREDLAVRVYVLSQIEGIMPIKAYEYLLKPGNNSQGFHKGSFTVDPAMIRRLTGQNP